MRNLLALAAAVLAAGCVEHTPVPFQPAPQLTACNVPRQPRVQLFGAFERPGTLAYEPGLTVYAAIQRGGGFVRGARPDQLRIIRCGRPVGPFPAPAAPGAMTDLPLELGDVLDAPIELY